MVYYSCEFAVSALRFDRSISVEEQSVVCDEQSGLVEIIIEDTEPQKEARDPL